MHIRLVNLDIVEPRCRIQFDITVFGIFAHNLSVYLTFRGYVYHHIIEQQCMTTQSATVGQGDFALTIFNFSSAHWGKMTAFGGDLMFGEGTVSADNLTAPAKSATAAN